MATLALAAAGSAIGNTLLPEGLSLFGTSFTGASIGARIGTLAGAIVDRALFSASGQSRPLQGPRLSSLKLTTSLEGAPVPRVYGRARLGGQIIWALDFIEQVSTSGGGKGALASGGGGGGGGTAKITYSYYATFAVGLCEGVIAGLRRVWADGQELDLSTVSYRLYTGTETQLPDSLIVSDLSADLAPAFRGLAYIVFDQLPINGYGRRIPQLSFEVLRPVDSATSLLEAVVMIPGSGEFVYGTTSVTTTGANSEQVSENVHTLSGSTDFVASTTDLIQSLPTVKSVSLSVGWFGSSLSAADCRISPAVEISLKATSPSSWQVAGLTRSSAPVVSSYAGAPAYGGTPSDDTVIAAVGYLHSQGLGVTLNPFLFMDIPGGNTLPDPYGGAAQAPYPWRGRITLRQAPGVSGSTDKTAAAAAEIAAFVGTAQASDFTIAGSTVIYSGSDGWTYRRFILHNAFLALAAGGVESFLIGSELRGLTTVRSASGTYPFVAALVQLAADVKSILGPATKVTYAADWSEYFGHQPADGSGDVYFHLDPLWSSPSIDMIGLDVYWPLADWRDAPGHLDAASGAPSTYDLAYLKSNIRGGEGFSWYYRSPADRLAQNRTPITDGLGKPWVFRYKDLAGWWQNQHFNRPAGVESAAPTAWVPQSKPFWLMEIGCPAIDKGANEPNAFPDPKSSEANTPYFSTGIRDDLIQRRYLTALLEGLNPSAPGSVPGANPVSSVYGAPMIDLAHAYVYAWDARPYPAFPGAAVIWSDAANWQTGHWLNGRIDAAPLDQLVATLLTDYGFSAADSSALTATCSGYVVDSLMSPREAIQPLELAYFIDSIESGGEIVFRPRGAAPLAASLDVSALVETKPGSDLLTLVRGQETDLPASTKIKYVSGESDYRRAVAESKRIATRSGRVAQADVPVVLEAFAAQGIANSWLYETWATREKATFSLPLSQLALEPGDIVSVSTPTRPFLLRITGITERGTREAEALSFWQGVYDRTGAAVRQDLVPATPLVGQPSVVMLDLPLLTGTEPPSAGYVAVRESPWPGSIAIYRSPETSGYALEAVAATPSVTGTTLSALPAGPTSRLDRATILRVVLDQGTLTSASELSVFAGSNAIAVENANGDFEVIQFETATLVAPSTYDLSLLLRGQAGTEGQMLASTPAGARVVLLGGSVTQIDLSSDEVGLPYNWRIGPASRAIGDPSYISTAHTFEGIGYRPYAPVHVSATRSGGDATLSWIRRTRIGGDTWDGLDVPLSEDTEAYEVDILSGSTVVRTLSASSPTVVYPAAQQTADFGAVPPSLTVEVYQLSTRFGRGTPASAVV